MVIIFATFRTYCKSGLVFRVPPFLLFLFLSLPKKGGLIRCISNHSWLISFSTVSPDMWRSFPPVLSDMWRFFPPVSPDMWRSFRQDSILHDVLLVLFTRQRISSILTLHRRVFESPMFNSVFPVLLFLCCFIYRIFAVHGGIFDQGFVFGGRRHVHAETAHVLKGSWVEALDNCNFSYLYFYLFLYFFFYFTSLIFSFPLLLPLFFVSISLSFSLSLGLVLIINACHSTHITHDLGL